MYAQVAVEDARAGIKSDTSHTTAIMALRIQDACR